MARKRRKPPNIGKPRPSPTGKGGGKAGKKAAGGERQRGVNFELEADAEELFLQEFEGMGFHQRAEDLEQILAGDDDEDFDFGFNRGGGKGGKGGGKRGGSGKAKPVAKASSKKSDALPMVEIDLHHHTQDEAKQALTRRLTELKSLHQQVKVRIITGKGRRSQGGKGVLVRTIHSFVVAKFSQDIETIQPCPSESTVDGRPIRGYFDIVFKF